jgi:hypothetical protein
MSQKKDKRRRKDIRRLYGDTLDILAEENARIIKPRPRFVPYPVWRFLIGFFIKINGSG